MSGLVVDAERCIGCRRCVRACGSAGIEVVDRLARPTQGCILCGACVDACPVDAISIERDVSVSGQDLEAYRDIWVFAQLDAAGSVERVALELVGKARQLAAVRGCRVVAVLGEGAGASDDNVRLLASSGADEVLRCRDDRLATLDTEVYARWLTSLAEERRPETVLLGATAFGRELAPAVAVRLRTGLTADCTVLEIDQASGQLQQTRPAFGGNLMATIVCPGHRPQMATVRPGIFPVPDPADGSSSTASPEGGTTSNGQASGECPASGAVADAVTEVELDPAVSSRVRVLEHEPVDAGASIADAEVLVVVGRGIGSKKNLPLMRRLAELLGAELGCTRPLVEAGWLEYRHQVGQTGVSVAPRLLLSIGVSGAIQHLAGIGGAQTVVAINEDPEAPIFGASDCCVVGDCIEVVNELVAQLERRS